MGVGVGGGDGGVQKGKGGGSQALPLQKGGGGKSFFLMKGVGLGTTYSEVVLMRDT